MPATIRQLLGIATAFAMLGVVEPVEALTFSEMEELDNFNSIDEGAHEANDRMFFFKEQSDFLLPNDVRLDANQPDSYNRSNAITPPSAKPIITTGTRVDSFYFSFDPIEDQSVIIGAPSSSRPTITFDAPILGIIYLRTELDNSQSALGNKNIDYPELVDTRRGFEESGDLITWGNDNRTLEFTANVTQPDGDPPRVDQARVLVEVPFEFSPGLGIVLAVGLIGSWELRKRLSKQSEINS